MHLKFKEEYITQDGKVIIGGREGIYNPNGYFSTIIITIYMSYVKSIKCYKNNNKIVIKQNRPGYYPETHKIDYDLYSFMFDEISDKIENNDQIDKITELFNKLDKLSAHVMNLMIAAEALPKDFDGEFP